MNKEVKSLALKLIEECEELKSSFLDLGNCGLKDDAEEFNHLPRLSHLEELNFGTYYWKDGKKNISSGLSKNDFKTLPTMLPKNLKTLHLCGLGLKNIDGVNQFEHLIRLELSDNNLSEVSINCNKLEVLGLSLNKITHLSESIVKIPNTIIELHLMCNDITNVDDNYFSAFKQLKILDLANTNITNIDFLKNVFSLQVLYLNELKYINNLKNFNRTIFNLFNLRSISLINSEFGDNSISIASTNGLTYRHSLFSEYGKNGELFEIAVFKDFLNMEMPSDIENFKKLETEQDQSENKSKTLKELLIQFNFSYPTFLVFNFKMQELFKDGKDYLDLGNCNLNDESKEFFLLYFVKDTLKKLYLGTEHYRNVEIKQKGNEVNEEQTQHTNFVLMASINDIATNVFNFGPPLDFLYLDELQMRNCQLKAIPKLKSGDKLLELDLCRNSIETLDNLELYPNLIELALHGNKIISFIIMKEFKHLQRIYMSSNKVQTIDFDYIPPALSEIYFSNNEISFFRIGVKNDLAKIVLHSNKIEKVEIILKNIDEKCFIDISRNPIIDCPDFVLNTNSAKEISTYFNDFNSNKSVKKNQGQTRVSKLVFLGDTGTGKTSVANYLITDNSETEDNTVFKEWAISDKLKVKIFDFNQEIYENELYNLFLDNDSTYVITWKADKIEGTSRLEYWLDTIKNVSNDLANTAIFIVQTHVADYYIDRTFIDKILLEKYNINDVFHINTLPNNFHLQHFKSRIETHFLDRIAKMQMHSDVFYTFRDRILNLEADENGQLDIKNLKDQKDDNDHFEIVSNFLHNIGYIFKFNKTCYKTEVIFDLLSSFIKNNIKANHGVINKSFEDKLEFQILRDYQLIHQHPTITDKYLSPKYLPESDFIEDILLLFEKDSFNDSITLKVPNFYYRKIMDLFLINYINISGISIIHFWKNGLFAIRKDKDKNINEHKILIKGFNAIYTNASSIRISVQKGEGQDAIYKEITSMITMFNFKNVKNYSVNADNLFDSLFIDRLEFSIGSYDSFFKHSDIKKGIESDESTFAPFVKYFIYSTNITQPKKVFISYSHSNAQYMYKLRTHFSSLRKSKIIQD